VEKLLHEKLSNIKKSLKFNGTVQIDKTRDVVLFRYILFLFTLYYIYILQYNIVPENNIVFNI